MKVLAALVLVFAVSGCIRHAPDARPVTFDSDEVTLSAEQRRTDMVLLRLRNGSGNAVGYNLCATAIERNDGVWSPLPSDLVCTMELRTLAPGATATFERELSTAVTPGRYRFVTSVEAPLGSRSIGVISNSVDIQ